MDGMVPSTAWMVISQRWETEGDGSSMCVFGNVPKMAVGNMDVAVRPPNRLHKTPAIIEEVASAEERVTALWIVPHPHEIEVAGDQRAMVESWAGWMLRSGADHGGSRRLAPPGQGDNRRAFCQ
jgi:hypothetical protein